MTLRRCLVSLCVAAFWLSLGLSVACGARAAASQPSSARDWLAEAGSALITLLLLFLVYRWFKNLHNRFKDMHEKIDEIKADLKDLKRAVAQPDRVDNADDT